MHYKMNKGHGATPDRLVLRLLVPHLQVGSIIGRSGQTIKSIREQTSAFIQVSQKRYEVFFCFVLRVCKTENDVCNFDVLLLSTHPPSLCLFVSVSV